MNLNTTGSKNLGLFQVAIPWEDKDLPHALPHNINTNPQRKSCKTETPRKRQNKYGLKGKGKK